MVSIKYCGANIINNYQITKQKRHLINVKTLIKKGTLSIS